MEYADKLELINGPEDGTEFPLVRTPVDGGRGQECGVQVRFDPAVRDRLVRITAVSEGYRIRRIERGRVLADGRRVGRIRSRVLRHGQVLQLGNTQFYLSLAEEGLAQRSHGMAMESDLGWLLRFTSQKAFGSALWSWRSLRGTLGCFWWPLFALIGVSLAVHWLLPGFFGRVWHQLWYWLGWARYLLWSRIG